MIHQLSYRCGDVHRDPAEHPHPITTHATARAEEATLTTSTDRGPHLVVSRGVGCWVAECDRCQRPAGDPQHYGTPAHHTTETALHTTLTGDGWVLGEARRVHCPGCAPVGPVVGIERVPLTLPGAGAPRQVLGELTACPELVIVPGRGADPGVGGVWWGLQLVHRPTGRYIPTPGGGPIGVLHRMAELLTDLDWSSTDPARYATGYAPHTQAAFQQAWREHLAERTGRSGGAR